MSSFGSTSLVFLTGSGIPRVFEAFSNVFEAPTEPEMVEIESRRAPWCEACVASEYSFDAHAYSLGIGIRDARQETAYCHVLESLLASGAPSLYRLGTVTPVYLRLPLGFRHTFDYSTPRLFATRRSYHSRSTMSGKGSRPPSDNRNPSEPSEDQLLTRIEFDLLVSGQNALMHSFHYFADTLRNMTPKFDRMYEMFRSKFSNDVDPTVCKLAPPRLGDPYHGITQFEKDLRKQRKHFLACTRIARLFEKVLGDVRKGRLDSHLVDRCISKFASEHCGESSDSSDSSDDSDAGESDSDNPPSSSDDEKDDSDDNAFGNLEFSGYLEEIDYFPVGQAN
ncbi:hypothetical protein GCK72_020547 [Caenorhabditis remanei]|uniref:Uncharacterized protein n=2 Tax=Caenorhabditis remanei TaxID=31234 RepID=A0A6A5GHR9_CAERE|nr:hypothetical protein GCK72_020547 [Caenorhabditis remanei]KAF1753989.1 hypothetical protein GCK72_020547 [Caenorhabditis remanei]